MKNSSAAAALVMIMMVAAMPAAAADLASDSFPTSAGELTITFIGHGTVMLRLGGTVVHVDPWSRLADYSELPKADVILVTHGHRDHMDPDAIAAITTDDTTLVVPALVADALGRGTVLDNGEETSVRGIRIEAVPAYNLVHTRPTGEPFHPKGEGNGYVVTFGDVRLYVGGDTEDVPEMRALEGIDIALLPMNLPYTMTPQMVADAARAFRPAVLYPYHYGQTDPAEVTELLAGEDGIEVRIRRMQ